MMDVVMLRQMRVPDRDGSRLPKKCFRDNDGWELHESISIMSKDETRNDESRSPLSTAIHIYHCYMQLLRY